MRSGRLFARRVAGKQAPIMGTNTAIVDQRDEANGVAFAVLAYVIWGAFAAFFSLLSHVSALEVLAHRAFWSIPVAGAVMLILGRTDGLRRVLRQPRNLGMLTLSMSMVAISWGVFVWGIAAGRTYDVSLAFYINPLLNVAVGFLVLRERMTPLQVVAVVLATVAVAYQTWALGIFPWLSLLLGGSFCMYGLIRRTVDVGPVQGFFVESVLLSIAAVPILWFLALRQPLAFGTSEASTWLLIASGPMTAAPLMFFAAAARRIRFSTLGLLQYIAPTLHFLTAVYVFRDPLQPAQLVTFGLIWLALVLYTISSLRGSGEAA
jgi:chloramphenicol-sensitive protein RarD